LTAARILLVDDEVDITTVLKKALEGIGFDIVIFNNPLEVLLDFKAGKFGLIILDIKMPRMDGFTLYEKLRQIDRDAKVYFFTAYNGEYREQFKCRFPDLDVKYFIQKPVSIRTIIKMIKEELALT
jgi:two-component system, OmpR family, response regulator ChvI